MWILGSRCDGIGLDKVDVTLIEGVVDFEYESLELFFGGVQMPNRNWVGYIIEEPRSRQKVGVGV